MYRILVFGDSIAYGSWDTRGGWVERLKADAHKRTVESGNQFKRQVFNLGVGGHTSDDILKRMDNEIEARAVDRWETALIFMYGANDERFINGVSEIGITEFKRNTEEIIDKAKSYTQKIILIGIPPLPEKEVAFKTSVYSDKRIEEYDEALKEAANTKGVVYIAVRQAFEQYGLDKVFNIGQDPHPNDKGHEVLYGLVQSKLEEMLA